MITAADIDARAVALGFGNNAQYAAIRASVWSLLLGEAAQAIEIERIGVEVEALRLKNLCERNELAKLGVDTSGIPVAP